MEEHHRQIITKNITKLIECTDYNKLINACCYRALLSYVMKNEIEKYPEDKRHEALFIKITQRGPTAFEQLQQIFCNLKFDSAARYLNKPAEFISLRQSKEINKDPSLNISDGKNTKDNISPPTSHKKPIRKIILSPLNLKEKPIHLKPIIKSTRIYDDNKIGSYPMRSKCRGIFFMVNIIEFEFSDEKKRNGAEIDGEALLHLFHELGFMLFKYNNLTRDQFHIILDELLESEHTRKAECFVMALMTHGSMIDRETDRVEFYDSSIEKINNILDKFRNDVCLNLVQKPKIFIFPFCRGEMADSGIYNNIETDSISFTNIPTYSDMLLCYASVPGFLTHREKGHGSWYVQMLYDIFADHAHDTHIEDMLKMVGEKTGHIRTEKNNLQTASFANHGFYKKLYFNPGIYEDNK